MFVKVDKSEKNGITGNKGSCTRLAEYLEKEDDGKSFFSSGSDNVKIEEVISEIDNNVKGLKANEDKFYSISINPSQAEQQCIIMKACGIDNDNTKDFYDLTGEQRKAVYKELMNYAREVMDIYARNFDRPNIKSGEDLKYFARIETMRRFRHYDKAVLSGEFRPGDLKPGLQLHIHVIVSRKSKDMKTSLSPNVKSRGNEWELNGKKVKRGFNHEDFKTKSQDRFNEMYSQYKNYLRSSAYNNYKSQHRNNQSPNYSNQVLKNSTVSVLQTSGGFIKGQITQGIKSATSSEARNQINKILRGATTTAVVLTSGTSGLISALVSSLVKYVKQIASGSSKQAGM